MQKYWVKCTVPKGEDMVLSTKAESKYDAAIRVKQNYNVVEVLEVKDEPYKHNEYKDILLAMSYTSGYRTIL